MNAEIIIEKIRDSIENYEVFRELALNIRFRKADRRFYSWSCNAEGMVVHLFRFADRISEENIAETVTQCRLMRVADNEEWEDGFWDVRDDRLSVLDAPPNCVSGGLIFRRAGLKPLDTEECLNTVRELMDIYTPEKDIFYPDAETKDTICDIIRKSQNIELGDIYSMVRMWLSVSEDTVLTVEFGVYD